MSGPIAKEQAMAVSRMAALERRRQAAIDAGDFGAIIDCADAMSDLHGKLPAQWQHPGAFSGS